MQSGQFEIPASAHGRLLLPCTLLLFAVAKDQQIFIVFVILHKIIDQPRNILSGIQHSRIEEYPCILRHIDFLSGYNRMRLYRLNTVAE